MTFWAKAHQCANRAAGVFLTGCALFIFGYVLTCNCSGGSYSSSAGTYCSGCAPKWSKP